MEKNEKTKCIGLGDSLDRVDGEEGVLGNWADGDNNNQAQNTEVSVVLTSTRMLFP